MYALRWGSAAESGPSRHPVVNSLQQDFDLVCPGFGFSGLERNAAAEPQRRLFQPVASALLVLENENGEGQKPVVVSGYARDQIIVTTLSNEDPCPKRMRTDRLLDLWNVFAAARDAFGISVYLRIAM